MGGTWEGGALFPEKADGGAIAGRSCNLPHPPDAQLSSRLMGRFGKLPGKTRLVSAKKCWLARGLLEAWATCVCGFRGRGKTPRVPIGEPVR